MNFQAKKIFCGLRALRQFKVHEKCTLFSHQSEKDIISRVCCMVSSEPSVRIGIQLHKFIWGDLRDV
jgi:hypothetical protein